MKKGIKLLVALSLFVSLTACSKKVEVNEPETTTNVEAETITKEVSYRSIVVSSIEGTATVKHTDGKELQAYEGMPLYNGDDVVVNKDSSLTIDVDSDKHLFAEANTHFVLSAQGSEENNQTVINLLDGSVLCQLQEKLKDGESFDVQTATSTMCVRGTVFRVSMMKSENEEDKFDMVEVYNGKVWSSIQNTDNEVTLEPGQCALIQEATDNKEASYVTADQIDEGFWNSSDTNIKIAKTEGTGSAVLNIAYNKLSSKVVSNLVTISESGQELSLTTEQLSQLDDEVKVSEQKTKEQVAQEALEKGITNETDFRAGALNDDICAQYGHSIIRVNGVQQCSVCGRQFNENYEKTEQDLKNEEAMKDQGFPMDIKLPEPKNFSGEVKFTDDSGDSNGASKEENTEEEKLKEQEPPQDTGDDNSSGNNNGVVGGGNIVVPVSGGSPVIGTSNEDEGKEE